VSWASPAPPYLKRGSHMKAPSPPNLTLKPSYSQMVKTKIPPCDPEKQAHDPGSLSRVPSQDPPTLVRSPDLTHDQTRSRVLPHDQIRSCALIQPHNPTCFGHAKHLLIDTWQTMGINQWSTRSNRSQGIPQGIPHNLFPMDTGTGNTIIGLRA